MSAQIQKDVALLRDAAERLRQHADPTLCACGLVAANLDKLADRVAAWAPTTADSRPVPAASSRLSATTHAGHGSASHR